MSEQSSNGRHDRFFHSWRQRPSQEARWEKYFFSGFTFIVLNPKHTKPAGLAPIVTLNMPEYATLISLSSLNKCHYKIKNSPSNSTAITVNEEEFG